MWATNHKNQCELCVILEPMQELMSRHKAYALSPRDCLKTTLFQKWQRMVAPPERLLLSSRSGQFTSGPSAILYCYTLSSSEAHLRNVCVGNDCDLKTATLRTMTLLCIGRALCPDVMVVGEPSLMGGEFGDEDERLITRLENTQYDAAAVGAAGPANHASAMGGGGGDPHHDGGPPPPTGGPPPPSFNDSPGGGGGGPNSWGGGGPPPPTGPPSQEDKKSPAVSQ
ncbi:hypothetical protein LSTR_LSTR013722 [Laodelphax striatellus]|uniref:LIM interaction domain-containing protein n=1 Tax=Laodelphax striatellus TaxID=195883 RepID=A0A482XJJ4_LAOST|nr:hypothetical protein LSTR_LSTR013722 [Laodelphax striatellus]